VHAQSLAFFDDFVAAFTQFDGALIARRYRAPYLAVTSDGSTVLYATQDEVGRYFQQVVNAYRSAGCRSCRYRDLTLLPLGERSALATVTWELVNAQGALHSTWRESYTLIFEAQGLRIVASMDHAPQT
jgi:hypothetical protein